MKFTHAITRQPGRSLADGITSASLGRPDLARALDQHAAYVAALRTCGVEVTVLSALDDYPDSVFIEDAALCTRAGAISSRPGAESRREEAALLVPDLRRFFPEVAAIVAPGTLDTGDVMMVGDHFYIGRSQRTNAAGAAQLISFLEARGLTGSTVPMSEALHLKTGLSYLENGHLLACGEFVGREEFRALQVIEVPAREAYAANSIWVNGRVIMPQGYPETRGRVAALGYTVIEVDTAEFQKLDGGVSCLSLRF